MKKRHVTLNVTEGSEGGIPRFPTALTLLALSSLLSACSLPPAPPPVIPAVDYSQAIKRDQARYRASFTSPQQSAMAVGGNKPHQFGAQIRNVAGVGGAPEMVEQMPAEAESAYAMPSDTGSIPQRDYNGPLSLGDPGLAASLWRESRADNDLFRDLRAWQPMDLLTIVVLENAEGMKEADTETKSQSNVAASIENFLGLEDRVTKAHPGVDLSSLVSASTQSNYKGEGGTTRRGSLRARISAMVVEILPSGVLRVEGQKIISVNNEEQIMVISGIVRTRDISSDNEIDSSRIANMRVDYYGSGIVGEAQRGGWAGRILRTIWPF